MRMVKQFVIFLSACVLLSSCAAIGGTNTTATNVAVTSYEAAGATLKQAFNTEKALFKAGAITAAQDASFQTGVYKKAYECYEGVNTAAIAASKATDALSKTTLQDKVTALLAVLPGLVTDVQNFISEVTK
jgi:hypothetical protein